MLQSLETVFMLGAFHAEDTVTFGPANVPFGQCLKAKCALWKAVKVYIVTSQHAHNVPFGCH